MLVEKSHKEVEEFLREFMAKMNIWGINFLMRAKNLEAITLLSLIPSQRNNIIKGLKVSDYSHAIVDEFSYGEMWVFGKVYKNTELYIKIAMGPPGDNTICISLHIADFPLKHPFKD